MPWFFSSVYALELLITLVAFVVYQPRRKKFFLRVILYLIAFFACSIAASYLLVLLGGDIFSFGGIYYFFVAFCLALAAWRVFDITLYGAIYLVAATYSLQHIGYAFGKIIRSLTGVIITLWADVLIIDFVVYAVIGCMVFFVFINPHKRNVSEYSKNKKSFCISLIFLVLCAMLNAWSESIFNEYHMPLMKYLRICCSVYSIIGCLFTIYLQFMFSNESRLEDEKNTLNDLFTNGQKQHEMMKETIEDINSKSHDLKKQLLVLTNIDDGKVRKDYISELTDSIAAYDSIAITGNAALDVVFSEKCMLCQKSGIYFSYVIDGEKVSFMSATDLATLFGNAIDNAVECVLKEDPEKRIINVTVKEKAGFVCIHIDNYCSCKPEFDEGLPRTTKEDKRNHGYGTKNIRNVVNKYNGDLCMDMKGDKFNLDAFIPVPDEAGRR